jgi:hypothetical protein
MAYTRHLCPKLNFILTQGTGTVDDQSLLIHLMSIRIESKRYRNIRELVDLRNLKNDDKLTVRGLIKIAETHREFFQKKDFLAAVLVNPPSTGKLVEIYSSLVTTTKLRVKVFIGEIDKSLTWLGYDSEDLDKLKKFITKHSKPLR